MVDLHLHTTASDGRYTPGELVARARDAGLHIIAITDHDTMAGIADAVSHARAAGIGLVPGIEITAVDAGMDVHMLAYFISPDDAVLEAFLATQRRARLDRVRDIGSRLEALGIPVDVPAILATCGQAGRAIGRPQVARAMVDAGHVSSVQDAFDRWLGQGRPACAPRVGPSPERVIEIVHASDGVVSLAHPKRTGIDPRIPALAAAGLDGIEVYHPDHDETAVRTYAALAGTLGLLVSGGSDFHGDPARGDSLGAAALPDEAWQRLRARRAIHA